MIVLALCMFLFFLAFLLVHLFVPAAQKASEVFHLYDLPSERKIHKEPISRFGGAAVIASILICLFFVQAFYDAFSFPRGQRAPFWAVLIAGSGLSFGLGLLDDVIGLNAFRKLSLQIVISIVVYFLGFRIDAIYSPISESLISFGWMGPVLTVFWMVSCLNAVNLVDGIDGLVSGLATICFVGLAAISCLFGYNECALVCVAVGGAAAGFLWFNFHPAKIFLGDCGSLLLGFLLSYLPLVILHSAQATGMTGSGNLVLYPGVFVILFIPFLDMLLATVRRGLRYLLGAGELERRSRFRFVLELMSSIFKPDTNHIHHELMRSGCGQRKTVLILYCIQGAFLVIGTGVFFSEGVISLVFFLLFAFVSYLLLRAINLHEVSEFLGSFRTIAVRPFLQVKTRGADSFELEK